MCSRLVQGVQRSGGEHPDATQSLPQRRTQRHGAATTTGAGRRDAALLISSTTTDDSVHLPPALLQAPLAPCARRRRADGAMPSFEAAVLTHAAASALAVLTSAKDEPTPAAALARLVSPPTPTATGLVLLANVGVSLMLLLAVTLKALFLGRLSALEAQNASERAISWLLFKLVTLAALETEPAGGAELLAWGAWYTFFGVLRVFADMARDRFERLSAAPSTTGAQHARTVALLGVLLVVNATCTRLVLRVFADAGGVTRWLLLHDCATVALTTALNAVRYAAHLYEVWLFNSAADLPSGEQRRRLLFAVDFAAEACNDVLSLAHSAALYWLHGLSLQLVDAIILLHLRALALGLMQRVKRFVGFLAVSRDLQRMYADVPADELAARQDDCAVCRERLDKAKRLPCGHLFHSACLQRWLEVKCECPTCRARLHR